MGAKHFGARVARLEDPTLLTGRGRFVDDIRLAGAMHACFVRSPHAHAATRSIDASAARAMPGVHAVLTADDLPPRMASGQIPMLVPNPSIKTPRTQLALARREVCYVGQTIAVAIADNRYLAEDAAAAVNIEFELLPAVSEVPDQFPAALLWNFRIASAGAQLIMWAALGLLFGALTQRAATSATARS